jgi:hypothetical protein
MVRIFGLFLCAALAACSQTGAQPAGSGAMSGMSQEAMAEAGVPAEQRALMARCEAAIRREQQKSIATARLGSALTMAAGFAGVGGAIAGDAISAGRSLAQAGAENSARTAIEKECMP